MFQTYDYIGVGKFVNFNMFKIRIEYLLCLH